MKQAILTGEYIFNQINTLKKEVEELGRAMDMITDDYGKDHAAYYHLEKAYKTAVKELGALMVAKYEVQVVKGFGS